MSRRSARRRRGPAGRHELSLALSQMHSPYWLLFTAFVGLNLIQSSLTAWCLMEDILRKLGLGPRHA